MTLHALLFPVPRTHITRLSLHISLNAAGKNFPTKNTIYYHICQIFSVRNVPFPIYSYADVYTDALNHRYSNFDLFSFY